MKLLSWNIQHGGGNRAAGIVDAIAAHAPDVIALSEFRTKPGVALCAALAARGWRFIESTKPTGSDNGLCALSRKPMVRSRPCPAPPENVVRWLDIDLPEYGFGFALLHIVCSVPNVKDGVRGEAKARFWNAVLGAAEARLQEPFMFIGDFNAGAHKHDETRKTFVCAPHFAKLSALCCADAGESTTPAQLNGPGTRSLRAERAAMDSATPSLRPARQSCRYSHAERDAGLSDHSMLIAEVE